MLLVEKTCVDIPMTQIWQKEVHKYATAILSSRKTHINPSYSLKRFVIFSARLLENFVYRNFSSATLKIEMVNKAELADMKDILTNIFPIGRVNCTKQPNEGASR